MEVTTPLSTPQENPQLTTAILDKESAYKTGHSSNITDFMSGYYPILRMLKYRSVITYLSPLYSSYFVWSCFI